jgi:hypothetical protein
MKNFIIRIELHDGQYLDYQNLHSWMLQVGFLRTIIASDGIDYHLPDAMYFARGLDLAKINELARSTASKTGKLKLVFTVEMGAWLSNGLIPRK